MVSLQKKVKNEIKPFLLLLTTLAAVALTSPLPCDNSADSVTKETVASDFAERFRGKFRQDKIDAAVEVILKTSNRHPADGSVVCLLFWCQYSTAIKGGRQFVGNSGGIGGIGGGALWGDVYTDNLYRLYYNTVSFEFNATPVYISLLFFDGNSNLLGHFQSGALSAPLIVGVGGGTGKWS
jgi:hypothetical protein